MGTGLVLKPALGSSGDSVVPNDIARRSKCGGTACKTLWTAKNVSVHTDVSTLLIVILW